MGTWMAFPVPASRGNLVRMALVILTARHRTELGRRKVRRHLLADRPAAATGEEEASHGVRQVTTAMTGMMRTIVTTRPSSQFEPAR